MIVTRFAPSPTGFLHIGGVRTALFSFLFARQQKGVFALRVEDTDKARSKEEWTKGLIDDLAWLGLKHDKYELQSENAGIHKEYLKKLIDSGHAYVSKEKIVEEGQREEVIRFKNPNKKITVNDLIRGDVVIDTTDLGDFVIARSFDEPVYHLAVVIDDFKMGITHVIRAEEHLSNTPRQILIQEAIGAPRPIYAHLPLVLAEDKSKLSKRKHGEKVSLTYYRQQGYLPEAILNFVALLGWNPGTNQEIFSIEELIAQFDIAKIQKGGGVFNEEKLRWTNKQYINAMDSKAFTKKLCEFIDSNPTNKIHPDLSPEKILELGPIIKDRVQTFGEAVALLSPEGEIGSLFTPPIIAKEKLIWKQDTDVAIPKTHLAKAKEIISGLSDKDLAAADTIKQALWAYAEEKGRGSVLWPLRYALSGRDKSPDPFTLIQIITQVLGKDEAISRITRAHDLL